MSLLLALLLSPPTPVTIVVLGPFPKPLVQAIRTGVEATLPVKVVEVERRALPKAAWYAPRKRYRAEKLLTHLAKLKGARPGLVLGLTSKDISTTKGEHRDWGIFGLANLGGPSAVVSSHRLRRKAKGKDQVRFRVVSTATHELGHALGLDHCPEARCVMQDAQGSIANTDEGTGRLGPKCEAALKATP